MDGININTLFQVFKKSISAIKALKPVLISTNLLDSTSL